MSHPEPIPYIGTKFYDEKKFRLMFIGIESYSNSPRKPGEKMQCQPFDTKQIRALFLKNSEESGITNSPFWNWVNEISTRVLNEEPEEAFTKIAYSNLHKCQSRKNKEDFDDPTYQLYPKLSQFCIKEEGWILREIEKINPKNVIIFSGVKQDRLLAKLLLEKIFPGEDREITTFDCRLYTKEHKDRCKKDIFIRFKKNSRRYIITNHPQGSPDEIKEEIIRKIID